MIDFVIGLRVPYLKSAYQSIIDILLKQVLTLAILARPSPHIFSTPGLFALIQYCSADSPHDYTEREESYREDGIVDGGFLCSLVTTSPVRVEDAKGERQRYARNAEQGNLRPCLLVRSPSWKITPRRQRFGGIEYCKSSREHRQDDETAAEVCYSKTHLGHSDSGFDFLAIVVSIQSSDLP